MQSAKEKASNAAASAKANMEKTKAVMQEKVISKYFFFFFKRKKEEVNQ